MHDASEDVFVFPMSFAQQRLWLLEQLEEDLVAYNLPYALRLRGPLDTESLCRALETILARHEPLRTNFRAEDGEPVQVVSPPRRLDLPCCDLRALPPGEREAAVAAQRRTESERPFDLGADLLLRAQLLWLAEKEYILLLTLHHIAADAWSVRVLWRELETLYDAYRRQADPDLPELPIQYVDFTVWQRNELQGERLERLLAYWRTQLNGLAALELPTDHPRPPQQSYRGASLDFAVLPGLADQLRQLSRAANVTLHMTMLAAFQTLLMRYSGQEDIAVGLPIAGRQEAELEHLIGFFVNMLVLRTDLSGQPTFRELLARVRHVSLDAYEHQDLPFEKLVEELNHQRHLDRSPLFQVVFQLLDFPDSRPALQGLDVERLPSLGGRVAFDLEMHLWTQPDHSLRGSVVYSTDLFDTATIQRMVGHFQALLMRIQADPDTKIDRLPLLTEAEGRQILVEWNDTAAEYPRDKCVHELFEEQARRSPDAIAVICEEHRLTYRELNEQANRLAHHLRSLGVGQGTVVGIRLRRSPELIAAMLGVLKAGGAYLPLDPQSPLPRQNWMLHDAGTMVLLTESALSSRLPNDQAMVLCLDAAGPLLSRQQVDDLPGSTTADDLIYIMYTSGSTGHPKGVEIRHRSVLRLVLGADYVRFGPDEVFLQLAPASFDASTFEIWGALLHGSRLVLAPEGVPDLFQLEEVLKTQEVTTLWLTAGLFNVLVEQRVESLAGLRQLLTGGEALSVKHVRLTLSRLPAETRLINGYGPTECTTFACCYEIPRDLPEHALSVPIGRPIANTRAYVLDRELQPLPIGLPGELYLGGDGLARGYRNQPGLTAAQFVPDPFTPDGQLYRTGDRVRWRPDGMLEYLGRLDRQLKVRGFRVEPGEVETALAKHPRVVEAVVLAHEVRPGEPRLVGYVVPPRGATAPGAEELREFLNGRLPQYMIPSALVVLDALPLTANGKLDRRALPEPDGKGAVVSGGYTAPRTEVEERLALMWAEALGLERVGIHDNFFELGGHSLMATGLFSRIAAEFERSVPLAILFRAQTVSELAAILVEAPDLDPRPRTMTLRTGDSRRLPLFLVHAISGEHWVWRPLINHLGTDRPVHGLTLPQKNGIPQAFSDIEALAAYHVEQMCAVEPKGPYHIAGYSFGAIVALEIAQQLVAGGREVGLLGAIDSGPCPRYRDGESSPSHLWSFTRNLYYWLIEDFLVTHPREMLARAYRRLKKVAERVRIVPTSPLPSPLPPGFEWLDTERIPSELRRVILTNYQTCMAYKPRPYPGRVTLLRARYGPLFHPLKYDMGWGRVALGGVEILTLRGNHSNIMFDPRVQELANQLRKCLEEADQSSPAPRRSPSLVDIAAVQPKSKNREQLVRAGRG
jgi:aspartate racemase